MENNEEELYGFIDFPLLERLKSYIEWMPLVEQVKVIARAKDSHEKAVALVRTLQWFAKGSATTIDDEALAHVEALLKTPEGREFFDWAIRRFLGR